MNEKTKWTPAPWVPVACDAEPGDDLYEIFDGDMEGIVCDGICGRGNAHLIAAAPAMAEALQGILEADDRLHTALAGMPGDPKDYADYVAAQANHELALRACRAALALAHGESK